MSKKPKNKEGNLTNEKTQKGKSNIEKQEENEDERKQNEEKLKKKLEEEMKWTIEQEEYDYELIEWKEFYIDFRSYRILDDYENQEVIVEILKKDLHKLEQFVQYEIRIISDKWASLKEEKSIKKSHEDVIKNHMECVQAFIDFHKILFEKEFQKELPNLYNSLQKEMYKNLNESFYNQLGRDVFQSTCTSMDKIITSASDQQLQKLYEEDEYLAARERYVLSTTLLKNENKRYAQLQAGFTILLPVVISLNLQLEALKDPDLFFYRGFFLMQLYLACLSFCMWVWSSYRIKYLLILDTPYQKERPVFWTSISNILLIGGCFYSLFNSSFLASESAKISLVIITFLLLLLGYKFIFAKIISIFTNLMKGISTFRITFLIDQMCSLSLPFCDFEYSVCYLYLGNPHSYCSSSQRLVRGFLIGAFPYLLRLISTLIQVFTTHSLKPFHKRPSLYSSFKYFATLFASWLKYQKMEDPELHQLWLIVQLSLSFFNLYWDSHHYWGLLKPKHLFLREKLLFKNHSIYALALMANVFLRFFWLIIHETFTKKMLRLDTLSAFELQTLVGVLEIIRRNIWNIFTLENQQIGYISSHQVVPMLQQSKMNLIKIKFSKKQDVIKITKTIAAATHFLTHDEILKIASSIKDALKEAKKELQQQHLKSKDD